MKTFNKKYSMCRILFLLGLTSMSLFLVHIFFFSNRNSFYPLGEPIPYDSLSFTGPSLNRSILDPDAPQYAIVACKVASNHSGLQSREKWGHQIRLIKVLLKSAAVTTKTIIQINLVTNSQEPYDEIVNLTKSWPLIYQKRIKFRERRQVFYPKELGHIQDMFTQCSTARLFLADALSDLDAVIFIDTDVLFMQPPENLWKHFQSFERRHVAGVTPCLYWYDKAPKSIMPHYSHTGINAGVLLLNLTRIRQFPGGWTNSIGYILKHNKKHIQVGDQDILNILFSGGNMPLVYEVGCEWNYRLQVCSLERNRCPNAAFYGVGILHGVTTTFVNNEAPLIKSIFESWEAFELGSPTSKLIHSMEEGLQEAKKEKEGCYRLSNIDDILMKGLKTGLSNEK